MNSLSTYVLWAAALVILAFLDRFYWRRGRCELIDVYGAGINDGFYRVGIVFNAYLPLLYSHVTYTLRDAKHPTTVITGKTRTLEFSRQGRNNEFLIIKAELLTPGDWIVDVKIESIGCRINPFYKIRPLTSHRKRTVTITKGAA